MSEAMRCLICNSPFTADKAPAPCPFCDSLWTAKRGKEKEDEVKEQLEKTFGGTAVIYKGTR